MNKQEQRQRYSSRKVILLLFALIIALPIWHVIYRAGAPGRAIVMQTISPTVSDEAHSEDGSLIILAYNIAHGRGLAESNHNAGDFAEREARLLEIAALLEQTRADVVVLNEVDFDAGWSFGIDQAVLLADHAGYPYIAKQLNIDIKLPFYTRRFGNAILSRHPIMQSVLLDLPAYSLGETLVAGGKKAMVARVQQPSGEQFEVIVVHLEHRDEATRVDSVQMLIDYCAQTALPLIAAGDFNSHHPDTPGAPSDSRGRNAIAQIEKSACLQNVFYTDYADVPRTFPSTRPDKTLDWIFTNDRIRVQEIRVIESQLSDHRPILGVLTP